jgi:uncharacterized surface protein with fasciclin (FAS1) repeats
MYCNTVCSVLQAIDPETLTTLSNPDAVLSVIAPVDSAFESAASTIAGLAPDAIADVLLLHVIAAKVTSADFSSGAMFPTLLEGGMLEVTVEDDGTVTFGAEGGSDVAKVITPDAPACAKNAALHLVAAG